MFSNNTKNIIQKFAKSGSVIARNIASKKGSNQKHAVVSGKSVTGMMSALNLQKEGYKVDIYDTRNTYNRNIQWAVSTQISSLEKQLECELFIRSNNKIKLTDAGKRFYAMAVEKLQAA